jgi:hypothetical protein
MPDRRSSFPQATRDTQLGRGLALEDRVLAIAPEAGAGYLAKKFQAFSSVHAHYAGLHLGP